MHDLQHCSLHALLTLVLDDRLIDSYRFTDEHLELTLGEVRLHLPFSHARTFLIGMLRGRSWSLDAALGGAPVEVGDGLPAGARVAPHVGAASLDDLLVYANLLDLIDDYAHEADGTVTLHLRDCSCPLPADDAAAYLAACIREELARMHPGTGEPLLHGLLAAGRTPAPILRRPAAPDRVAGRMAG